LKVEGRRKAPIFDFGYAGTRKGKKAKGIRQRGNNS